MIYENKIKYQHDLNSYTENSRDETFVRKSVTKYTNRSLLRYIHAIN